MSEANESKKDKATAAPSGPADSTRFDEEQFALILRKAAELQARDTARPRGGISLREIEGIAAEAGIDPRYVRQALAVALPAAEPGPLGRLVGMPFRLDARHSVPGELDRQELSAIIDALQFAAGRPGSAREVLGGVEWKAKDAFGSVQASVRRTGDDTRIHIEADRRETAAVLGILFPVAGFLAGTLHAATAGAGAPAALIILASSAGGFGVARVIWEAISRKWRRRVEEMMTKVIGSIRTKRTD